MKKFLIILLLIPIINFLQAQNDSAFYDNIGIPYQTIENNIASNDSLFIVLNNREISSIDQWLPENMAGISPEDLYYVTSENKLYVYGKRNIIVIDPSTNSIINQLNVSNLSQYYPSIENTQYLNYNHFAYNPNSKVLFCVLEDASVIAIDVESPNDDFSQIISTPPACANLKYNNFFLKYNNKNDLLFFVIDSDVTHELIVYDGSDYSFNGGLSFNNPAKNIRGIEVSESRDEFYLSIDNFFSKYQYDPFFINGTGVTETQIGSGYQITNSAGNMLLVDDATNSIDKLFCFPNRNATGNDNYFILNLGNGLVTTKTCPAQITSALYDGNGKVVISNRTNIANDDLIFINATNYNTVTTVNTQSSNVGVNDATLDMELLNGKILLAKESEIVTVDPSANYFVNQALKGENNFFSRIALSNNKAYVNGVWSTDLIEINSSGVYNDMIDVGGTVFYACHSPANNKIYFYNKHRQGRGKVYIYNTSTEDVSIIKFESAINDIEINPFSNNALISTEESSSKIKVIDGTTDVLLDEQYWININHGYIGEMFISESDKLYSIIGEDPLSGPGIEIWQLGSSSNTFISFEQVSANSSDQIEGVFCTNSDIKPTTDFVYAAIKFPAGPNLGYLAVMNDDNNQIETKQIAADAFDIEFSSSNYVYIAHTTGSSTITQYSVSEDAISTFNVSGDVYDLEANLKKGYLYALHRYNDSKMISTIVRNSATPFISDLPIYSTTMKFNNNTDYLYVHVPYTVNDCTYGGTQIIEILDNADNIEHISTYGFEDEHRLRYVNVHIFPVNHSLILDNTNGYLYFGGGGHNLIHQIELPVVETLQLRENITWLSIPRHERTVTPFQTETELVLDDEYINGSNINTLSLAYNFVDPTPPHDEEEEYSTYLAPITWAHGEHMPLVNSTRGYKLQITPNQARTLYMFGEQEAPYTTIDLYEDKSNWIGYFIEEEQDIFDALGSTVDDIYDIKHQDWTCIFTAVPWFGPISQDPEEPRWYCDHQQTNIKYGEMVVVKPYSDITGFQWNNPDQGTVGGALPLAQNFTYEEEADYQTYMIALDSTDNPVEIGLFEGDTCIGACVVDVQDTIAMIKGYNKGSAGDSISFEAYYGNKSSAKKRIREYYVYNEKAGRNEKRAIRSGELKDVYFISFSDLKVKQVSDKTENGSLIAYPNPAYHELTVEFELTEEGPVTIYLYDLFGRIVQTIYKADASPGKNIRNVKLIDQNGGNLPEGLYILRMESNSGQIASQKIMVR